MVSAAMNMPRKKRSYALDERVIDAIQKAARDANMSANRYLEGLMFVHAKSIGKIPLDAQPLGELRGGDFTNGRKDDHIQQTASEGSSQND